MIPPKYEAAFSFSKNPALAAVVTKDGWGFINEKGAVVIPPAPGRNVFPFADGLALAVVEPPVTKEIKAGYLNRLGRWAIAPRFENGWPFREGLAGVRLERKWGFIDKKGQIVIPCGYDMVCAFSEGFAAVQIGDRWGYIDRKGDVLWKPTK